VRERERVREKGGRWLNRRKKDFSQIKGVEMESPLIVHICSRVLDVGCVGLHLSIKLKCSL
jgi:nucleoside phosphorylase